MLPTLRLKEVVGWKERESRYYSGREDQSLGNGALGPGSLPGDRRKGGFHIHSPPPAGKYKTDAIDN
jgi:hypothetical protein